MDVLDGSVVILGKNFQFVFGAKCFSGGHCFLVIHLKKLTDFVNPKSAIGVATIGGATR